MKIGSSPGPSLDVQYATRVQKLAMATAKDQGEAAVQLIEEASAPPVGPQGQGSHVNTTA